MTALSPGELIGMNRRKSLVMISLVLILSCEAGDIPPFSEVYDTVVIRVNIVEEAVEARVGNCEAGADKGGA